MDNKQNPRPMDNAMKLVGEAFLPGASLLMDGKILAGTTHTLLGWAARAALGPIGLGLVIANSYATSTTGRNLIKQFTGSPKPEPGTSSST